MTERAWFLVTQVMYRRRQARMRMASDRSPVVARVGSYHPSLAIPLHDLTLCGVLYLAHDLKGYLVPAPAKHFPRTESSQWPSSTPAPLQLVRESALATTSPNATRLAAVSPASMETIFLSRQCILVVCQLYFQARGPCEGRNMPVSTGGSATGHDAGCLARPKGRQVHVRPLHETP